MSNLPRILKDTPTVCLYAIAENAVKWLPKASDWPMIDANGRKVEEPDLIRELREAAENIENKLCPT